MENNLSKTVQVIDLVTKGLLFSLILPAFLLLVFVVYRSGYTLGYVDGQKNAEDYYLSVYEEMEIDASQKPSSSEIVIKTTPVPTQKTSIAYEADWGGVELWNTVNEERKSYGVNPLSSKDDLCTIASIRLNELLELGKLDGHEGFSNLAERRPDLEWVFENYAAVAEFLAMGGQTAEETVSLWENTLGHKKLLTGGEYVWGCIYAQDTFAVAITAF